MQIDPSAAREARPRAVVRAVQLLASSLGLGVVSVLVWARPGEAGAAAVGLAVLCGLLVAIAGGKNWARVLTAGMIVLGLPPTIAQLIAAEVGVRWVVVAALSVLQLAAVALLFTRAANAWFRPAHASASRRARSA